MARQTQSKSKKPRVAIFTDFVNGRVTGVAHRDSGRGANIRFVTRDGDVIQSNPRAYRKLSDADRNAICGGIMASLGRA